MTLLTQSQRLKRFYAKRDYNAKNPPAYRSSPAQRVYIIELAEQGYCFTARASGAETMVKQGYAIAWQGTGIENGQAAYIAIAEGCDSEIIDQAIAERKAYVAANSSRLSAAEKMRRYRKKKGLVETVTIEMSAQEKSMVQHLLEVVQTKVGGVRNEILKKILINGALMSANSGNGLDGKKFKRSDFEV